jgi:hypothetical protein
MTAIVVSPIKRALLSVLQTTPGHLESSDPYRLSMEAYSARFQKPLPEWFKQEHQSHQILMIEVCIRLNHEIWSSKPKSEMVYACSCAISLEMMEEI